jgi:hypothetical protein
LSGTQTLSAKGGDGGSVLTNTVAATLNESEGPGGGGGGGLVAFGAGLPALNFDGGMNGNSMSPSLTEFPFNGATKGAQGQSLTVSTFTTQFLPTLFNGTVPVSASSKTLCSGDTVTLSVTGVNNCIWQPGNLSGMSVTVNPLTSTVYTAMATSANFCGVRGQTISLYVVQGPTVTAASSTPVICSGKTATLTGNGAQNFFWQPGNISGKTITVSPFSNTTYTLTGSVPVTCGTMNALVNLSVNPSPTITASGSSNFICLGENVVLTVSGGINYTWTPGNFAASQFTISPPVSTVYSVSTENPNGCSAEAFVQVQVDACNGLIENRSTQDYAVYPNPSTGLVNIEVNSATEVRIYTMLGELVKTMIIEGGEKINLLVLNKGCYFAEFRQANTRKIQKVIVE